MTDQPDDTLSDIKNSPTPQDEEFAESMGSTAVPDDDEPAHRLGLWVQEHSDALGLRDFDLAQLQKEKALSKLASNFRNLPGSINPHHLAETGWALIFPSTAARDQRSKDLQPLIDLRKQQLRGDVKSFVRKPKETGTDFLARFGETFGTIRPQKLAYYLLIVASPDEISFRFQYQLALSRAVGRIWFQSPADYTAYAQAVRKAEEEGIDRPRQVTLFSVENDPPTETLGKELIDPMKLQFRESFPQWAVREVRKQPATKQRLGSLLGGGKTPALLMVSSHGKSFPEAPFDVQQRRQGSLLCYPENPEDKTAYFSADDVIDGNGDLHGLITFFFACYGIGTPKLCGFPHVGRNLQAVSKTSPILKSAQPFLSQLPLELLRRGALAVVGHVDRGWTTGFHWRRGENDLNTTASLEDSLDLLLRGHRLGHAMRPLNRRYSQLAARLSQKLDLQRMGAKLDLKELGFDWTAVNDARNLIIVGDPAVYLLGRRQSDRVIYLDPELHRQLEKKLSRSSVDMEQWIEKVIKNYL